MNRGSVIFSRKRYRNDPKSLALLSNRFSKYSYAVDTSALKNTG
jgi:hypothetical protein